MFRSLLYLFVVAALWAGAFARAQDTKGTRDLPPLEHPQVSALLDALRIDNEIELLTAPFWQPAIDAFLAANPAKLDDARSFATATRNRERASYRPLVGFMLDRNLPTSLYPDLSTQIRSLSDCRGRTCAVDQATRARKYQQLKAEGERRFRADLPLLIKQAASPDAIALRELNRKGLWDCLSKSPGHWISKQAEDAHRSRCAPLLANTTVLKLQRTPAGQRLIALETAAYVQLTAMVAMTHDPGISLYLLLPPEKVREAGLQVPAENLSMEQLLARFGSNAGNSSE